jgi:hypothetical protein
MVTNTSKERLTLHLPPEDARDMFPQNTGHHLHSITTQMILINIFTIMRNSNLN